MDARSPIALAAVLENASDLANQVGFGAALRRSGLSAGLPVMEPAAGDTQNRAQQADRISGHVGGDESEFGFHAFSAHLAKKAEAFRRIFLLLEPLVVAPPRLQFQSFHFARGHR